MSDRYSILRPLTMHETEKILFAMSCFFAPSNSEKIRTQLGKSLHEKAITPLSINDFFFLL